MALSQEAVILQYAAGHAYKSVFAYAFYAHFTHTASFMQIFADIGYRIVRRMAVWTLPNRFPGFLTT